MCVPISESDDIKGQEQCRCRQTDPAPRPRGTPKSQVPYTNWVKETGDSLSVRFNLCNFLTSLSK